MKTLLPLLLSAAALSACQPPGPSWSHDVKPIVDGRCVSCHQQGGIGPFALTSYETAKQMAPALATAVKTRKMPPWHAGPADVTYANNPSLTDAQIDAIVKWSEDGAPEGDKREKVAALAPVAGGISRVDLELRMKGAYSPLLDPDDYRCFPIDWPYSDLRYITGFNAVPGNTSIVHHIALYAVGPDNATKPVEWDAQEPGDGYTCFGGPNGSHPADIPIQLLGFWVPGSNGMDLPEGLGLPVQPGSRLVLQLHYNRGRDASDQTALQFKIDPTVARPAYYLPFLKLDWAVGNMKIPAGANPVQHAWIDDPRNFWSLIAPDVALGNGFDVYAAAFHMHQLGVSGTTSIIRQNQTRQSLLTIPAWDFHWQREYRFTEPVIFSPGDKLELRCNYDNSAEHQPYINGVQKIPADVNWGEGTGDEMCESTLLLSPR